MFGSTTLDIVIGLILIYLLYSLLATSIQEIFATLFGLRARMLEKGIGRMLEDGFGGGSNAPNDPFHLYKFFSGAGKWIIKRISSLFYFFIPINFFKTGFGLFPQRDSSMKFDFYDLPQIKYLGENKLFRKPSYISKDNFSKSILDLLRDLGASKEKNKTIDNSQNVAEVNFISEEELLKNGINNIPDAETKKLLSSLFAEAKKKFDDAKRNLTNAPGASGNPPPPPIDNFKGLLENWFDDTVNRVSGWYKRSAQLTLFIIGFVLAVSFNVDTFKIVQKLSKDKNAREQAVRIAATRISAPTSTKKDSATAGKKDSCRASCSQIKYADSLVRTDVPDANSIIANGWGNYGNKKTYWEKVEYVICQTAKTPRSLLGFLITAIAISLGAAFWFDLLNKFMQIRNAGKKPEEKEKTNK